VKNVRSQFDNTSVSVIVPVRGKLHLLSRALNSLLTQNCLPSEIIVIDDNVLTSESLKFNEILRNFEEIVLRLNFNLRIKILVSQGKGVSAARNLGIKESSSIYISFLDSDDYFLPDKLSIQLSVMEKENLDFTHSNYLVINENKLSYIVNTSYNSGYEQSSIISYRKCLIATPTVLIRKSILNGRSNLFPEEYGVGEDKIAWARFANYSNKPIGHIALPLSVVSVSSESSSQNAKNIKKAKEYLIVNAKKENYRKLRMNEKNGIFFFMINLVPTQSKSRRYISSLYKSFRIWAIK
jgi:glycosyltransferase involved in cell wall biosynthesis